MMQSDVLPLITMMKVKNLPMAILLKIVVEKRYALKVIADCQNPGQFKVVLILTATAPQLNVCKS